jgi:dTDP-glucose 4,6-dehydratase
MRAVVTGGAGFMGSALVRRLLEEGYEVHVVDKFTYAGRPENLKEVMDKIKIHKVDVADFDSFYKTIKEVEPDVIFHLAAESHVDRSFLYPKNFLRTNTEGTFNLLEILRRVEARAVITSTDEVYGDRWGKPPCDEECKLEPSNPYSASKAAADQFVIAYYKTYGIDVSVVRPSNNYGPRQYPEKLIPRTIIRVLSGKPPQVHGSGKQLRDWLYVEDFCEGILTVAKKGKKGEFYNMPAGQERSVLDVVKTILRIMGKPEDWIEFLPDRPSQDMRYAMIGKKIEELGWRPRVKFEEGIKKTIKWYKENEWWWKPLIKDV